MVVIGEIKPYRIIARLKNNRLWQAIVEKWPEVKNQSDAARELEITAQDICHLLNMTIWPAKRKKFEETGAIEWWPIAEKLWLILEKDPMYLFSPKYYGVRPRMLAIEFKPDELEQLNFLSLPSLDDTEPLQNTVINKVLATLTPREEQVLRLRFGIGEKEYTLQEIGEKFTVSRDRIRQIEAKALRKMRHI